MVFAIALLFCVILATALVGAIPPDPTEGELEDTAVVGDWNWQIRAYVWGHWTWIPGTPSTYKFVEEEIEGERHATYGVWVEGKLTLHWGHDGYNFVDTEDKILIVKYSGVCCDHVYAQSDSWFFNWIGQHWHAYSGWAEISI